MRLAVLLLLAFPAAVSAQTPEATVDRATALLSGKCDLVDSDSTDVSIFGRVEYENESDRWPLARANVFVLEARSQVVTDANGCFAVLGLQAGTYTIRFFDAFADPMEIDEVSVFGSPVRVDAVLGPPASRAEPVVCYQPSIFQTDAYSRRVITRDWSRSNPCGCEFGLIDLFDLPTAR